MHESNNEILASSLNLYLRRIHIISKDGRFYVHLFLLESFMSNAICSCEQFTSVFSVETHDYVKKRLVATEN